MHIYRVPYMPTEGYRGAGEVSVRRSVGTNLIHDFTAVTFSVKLAFFREKCPFLCFREIRDFFCEFQHFYFHLWRFSEFYQQLLC